MMTARLIDGKKIAEELRHGVAGEVAREGVDGVGPVDDAQRDQFWSSGAVAEQFLVFFRRNPGAGAAMLRRVTRGSASA